MFFQRFTVDCDLVDENMFSTSCKRTFIVRWNVAKPKTTAPQTGNCRILFEMRSSLWFLAQNGPGFAGLDGPEFVVVITWESEEVLPFFL